MGLSRIFPALASAALAGGVLVASPAEANHSFTISDGVYRIPFANGTNVTITNDHHDHAPVQDRIDMVSGGVGTIVASASGVIRAVVDFNGDDPEEHSCTDNTTVAGDCSDYNNYVWIEHPNGEWSKYSHFETGTVTANGWAVGDTILVGQALGTEGDVGAATGIHLHYEIAIPSDPTDPTPFSTLGGFIQGVNVVPFVCDIPTNLYDTGSQYVAADCVSVPAPALCTATPPAPIGAIIAAPGVITVGTAGNDVIYGTPGPDRIYGLGGDDTIIGGGGNDQLVGGDGADTICGGVGNDQLVGSAGSDILSGGGGNDDLSEGAGDGQLYGWFGADRLAGGAGTDACSTGGDAGDSTAFCE